MKKVFYLLLLTAAVLTMGSCMDDESFDTPESARLDFSVDTLRLDTVIAGIGTPTSYFMVYNPNSKGVSITNIYFKNNRSNGFRVNVDGMYVDGGLAQSVDCRSKDSLRAFVELTPEAFDDDNPVKISATLIFHLANGVEQPVELEAWSQNVVVLRAQHITDDVTFDRKRPYLIYDSLTVDKGVTLTIAAGARLMFHSNAGMRVDGTLKAQGEAGNPVVFRGDRTDLMFVNQPYDRVPNQWQGIRFTRESYGNVLNHCDIHSGSYGVVCDSADLSLEKLRVENSVLTGMSGNVLTLYHSKVFVGNSQITNAGGDCVAVYGGDADFIHCTIGQFYPFSGERGSALTYTNEYNHTAYPLEKLYFRNCIISGYADDEIFGSKSADFPDAAFNYGFFNCLLDTPEITDDSQVLGCAWDKTDNPVSRDKNFFKFDNATLLYDFRLSAKSLAVGLGDISVTSQYYPQDMNGVDRLSDGQSDAGCYEHVPAQE
jgi:hypothetical protein